MKFRVQSALFPRQLNLFDISAAITPQRWRHIDSARALNRIREAALLFAIPLLITLLSMWVRIGGISSRTLRFTFLSSSLPSSFVLYSWLTRLSRASVSVLASCRGEECGHEELVRCARPLERISSNDLSLVVTKKEELNKLCPWVFHLYSACPGDPFWAENVRCYLSLLYMFHEGWDAVATGLLRTILWRWFFSSPFFLSPSGVARKMPGRFSLQSHFVSILRTRGNAFAEFSAGLNRVNCDVREERDKEILLRKHLSHLAVLHPFIRNIFHVYLSAFILALIPTHERMKH